jgi:hypothetical protein
MRAIILTSFAILSCVVSTGADPAHEHHRAGYPQETHHWAKPSDTGRYTGYLVGGGAVVSRRGDGPLPHEGTWGWDYVGGLLKRRVVPGWWHGRRYQGGTGRYSPEGPTLLPRLKD